MGLVGAALFVVAAAAAAGAQAGTLETGELAEAGTMVVMAWRAQAVVAAVVAAVIRREAAAAAALAFTGRAAVVLVELDRAQAAIPLARVVLAAAAAAMAKMVVLTQQAALMVEAAALLEVRVARGGRAVAAQAQSA